MQQHLFKARNLILAMIDFFYPPLKKVMPLQTFRYAVSGAGNTVLGLCVYYVAFKFLLKEENVYFKYMAFKPHTAALLLSFIVSFIIGFLLMKYVVFDDSRTRGRVQLVRYAAVCTFNLLLNVILLKTGVEVLHIYPTIAQLFTSAIVIVVSYLAQRHFTFKKAEVPAYIAGDEDATA